METKPSEDATSEIADDIENMYGLHQDHRRVTAALQVALLAVLDTIDDKFPGMRQIVIADMREAAEKERAFMRMRREADPAANITDDDIEDEMEPLEDLIFKFERRMITD